MIKSGKKSASEKCWQCMFSPIAHVNLVVSLGIILHHVETGSLRKSKQTGSQNKVSNGHGKLEVSASKEREGVRVCISKVRQMPHKDPHVVACPTSLSKLAKTAK